MRVWREVDSLPVEQLPDGFGMLSDQEGRLRFLVRTDGEIFELHTLGDGDSAAEVPTSVSLFSLRDDLLARDGASWQFSHAYRFALGEPVGFDA
jgi:hypothetical protein